jgi:hypothetical protein
MRRRPLAPLPCSRTSGVPDPPIDVVQANTLHGNESLDGRVYDASFLCKPPIRTATAATNDDPRRDRKSLPAATEKAFRAIGREASARDLVTGGYTVGDSGRCSTARASKGMLQCGITANPASFLPPPRTAAAGT